MKTPYSLPNGLSIEEGLLWHKRMEAFHAALNANYAYKDREVMKEISSEKTQEELGAAQVSLKEREEELNSAKEALSAEELKCQKLQEEKQAMELEHAKRYNALEAEMEKLKSNQSSLGKDIRLSRIEEFKESEEGDLFIGKESAAAVAGFVTKFLSDCLQLVGMYNQFQKAWPEEYFEGLVVGSPLVEAPAENIDTANVGGDIAEEDATLEDTTVDDASTS
ncbi:hypothetical protein LIER_37420 [Lithospermum erythrorhizon]|uniref:Uncharacterized protein n=1 Tax=Lithospermum erythrorhizon TaxID=34254 RepID=A0AAV3PK96_LITER